MDLIEDPKFDAIGKAIRGCELSELSPGAVSIWFLIRFGYSRSGKGWPGLDTLSDISGRSKATIKRNIRELKESGFLSIESRFDEKGRQMSNLYTITMPNGGGVHICTPGGSSVTLGRGSSVTPPGGSPVTPKQGNSNQGNIEQPSSPPEVECYAKPAAGKKRLGKKAWKTIPYPEDFDSWWKLYPRKSAKREALRAWFAAESRDRPTVPELILITRRWSESKEWTKAEGKYVPRGDRWLDRDGWLETPTQKKPPAGAPRDVEKYGAWKDKLNSVGVRIDT